MNLKKVLTSILTIIMLFSVCVNDIVLAENSNALKNTSQVVYAGGLTSNEEDGVYVSKTIKETGMENYFDITLNVTTTANISEIVTDNDLEIVIVMDVSNTMIDYNVNGKKNESSSVANTRYTAAVNAAEDFITKFAKNSKGNTAIRKIGFVAFNRNATEIASLSTCKTDKQAEKLVNDMKNKTWKIVSAKNYSSSHDRFTNIEAGLKRAKNMLSSNVKNQYIILITDGFPTTYVEKNYTGYDPYTPNAKESKEGSFYNQERKLPCRIGTSYSNLAAIRARQEAEKIKKEEGIKIFSVGTGLDYQQTIQEYIKAEKENPDAKDYSTIDAPNKNYEIGKTKQDYKNWLKDKIGSGYYYDTTDEKSLINAYEKIFKEIEALSSSEAKISWIVDDPMGVKESGADIQFLGIYDDLNALHNSISNKNANQSNTASYKNNAISWDLKNSNYTEGKLGKEKSYIYEMKYRVRLENELSKFDVNDIYETNERTTLAYVVRTKKDKVLTKLKYIDFKIPTVVGYLGELKFVKKSSFDDSLLSGAKFKLSHDSNCDCYKQAKAPNIADVNITDFIKTSDKNGEVVFDKIPSGHKYILEEINAPSDYIKTVSKYNVEVSYGKTSGGPTNNTCYNDIEKGNLEIQKILNSQSEEQEEFTFDFVLDVTFNGKKLTGLYDYKLNNGETKKIDLSNGKFYLKKDDKLVIYNLPVGATYKIQEKVLDGFKVEYEINNTGKVLGATAICSSNCRIESAKSNINKVVFTNTAPYLLPETGSSAMIYMKLFAGILLVIPIIYSVSKTTSKKRKSEV